jgi:DHA1 family bicyclomycin/chloramphenicol resistance-like MFS transporter
VDGQAGSTYPPTLIDPPVRPRRAALIVLILGLLMAAGPLATDLYLPALPQIAADLHAPESRVQLTLTAIMVGMGLGQLVIGPLSDAWGRRRPLLVGSAVSSATSLACVLVPSTEVFIALRFVQGIAGAAGLVVGRAVVRDLFEGDAAARIFSRMSLVIGLAPILGPIIGGQLLLVGPWRLGFAALGLFSAVGCVIVLVGLPESLPVGERRPLTSRAVTQTVGRLLRAAAFVGPAGTLALSFGMMFTYVSAFSFVSQHQFGATAQQFSAIFAVNTVGLIAGTQVNAALIGRVGTPRRLLAGLVGALLSVAVLTALGLTGRAGLVSLTCALAAMMFSVGFVLPNATTLAITPQRRAVAGTASALLGSVQFALGGGLAALTGLTTSGQPTLTSMTVVMAGSGVAALTIFVGLCRRPPAPPPAGTGPDALSC